MSILPAQAVVTAAEALNVRKGHSVHANVVDWLKHNDKIEVLDIWRGEDEVWAQLGSGRWSAMEYEGRIHAKISSSASPSSGK